MKDPLSADSRIHYLDNIRSVIVVFVVLFHAILPYVYACPWWYVNDPPPIPFSFFYIVILEPVLMPILFLIAGLLTWPSFNRKGASRFMAGKAKRLIFPFLLLTIFFSPIMPFIRQYLRAAGSGGEPTGFWPFWLSYIGSVADIHQGSAGRSSDLIVNQYWFLALLFLFFAGFCLYASRRRGISGQQAEESAWKPGSRAAWLVLIAAYCLLLGAIYAFINRFIGGTDWVTLGSLWQIQPAKIPIYLGFFLAGIFIERRNLLHDILGISRPLVWFAAAVLIAAAYLTTVIKTAGVPGAPQALVIASRFLRIFLLASVTLWLLTLFHNRYNRNTTMWRELSANSYNIYLIHMVPQVAIQLMLITLPVPSIIKYGIVSLITLLVSYLASRFIVKRSPTATLIVVLLIFVFMSLAFT